MIFLNKKRIIPLISLLLLFVFLMPVVFISADPLVPCNNTNDTTDKCDFTNFITMINNIINWIISISVVIFTISAVYGGFLYVTSGLNPANKAKAKSILWSTLIGFVIILVAWLIIYTIIITVAKDEKNSYILNFFKR